MNSIRNTGPLILLVAGFTVTSASGLADAAPNRQPAYVPKPAEGLNWSTTYVDFKMPNKDLREVVEWFADQAKLPVQDKLLLPDVSFTFIPAVETRRYALTEVFDIINELLIIQHKHILLRGETTLTVWPADEDVPAHLIRRVQLKDLPRLAQTEIVEAVVKRDPDFVPNLARRARPVNPGIALGNNRFIVQTDVVWLRRSLAAKAIELP